ncbi:MAG: hypothetical protein AUI14_05745 [Actinobacteria bacterium 13_2_20CM_2_71_6]|nr:MAG: hypothetical protein AUI14_05745 [Actinobacteria bacterium 13_2_20CM_2_71_6]
MSSTTVAGPEFLRRRIQEQRELPSPDARRQLREACGLSVNDLAQSVGVTPAAVRQWERGERAPRGELRRRYVEALRVLKEATAS